MCEVWMTRRYGRGWRHRYLVAERRNVSYLRIAAAAASDNCMRSAQIKDTYGTIKCAVHTSLQKGELDTHDTFSSGAYQVVMGMAGTLFMLFTNTRLQFRIAGEVEPSTSELVHHISQDRYLPVHPASTKSRTPHRWPESCLTCPGNTRYIAQKHV